VHYDPLISKLIIHGESREACLLRLRRSLAEFEIAGVSTNIEFLRALAKHPAFIDGKVETGFIEVNQLQSNFCLSNS
jgi:3-methylcrotonyl-CoA carboxylase alpha subunit